MNGRVFVDTNVLVYSRDASEPRRQPPAADWMKMLWETRTGVISYQVLQDYYVTVTRKLKPELDEKTARNEIRLLVTWQPIVADARVVEHAWSIRDQFSFSWRDALIDSTAQISGCRYLLSEDFQDRGKIGDLTIINPFTMQPDSPRA
jgi:predicted nucleic acid-binding protein